MKWTNSDGITILGAPKNFCSGTYDGAYTNPKDETQFFYCSNNVASKCLFCTGSLVFKEECQRCLHRDQS